MNTIQITALIIFILTYTGIIFTRLPGVNIDRPSAAFFGAVAMIISGILSFGEAMIAIDFNTMALLLGMMIIITTLRLDGFFTFIAARTLLFARTKLRLLVIIVFVTGICSAFMVNDAVVLLFTPVIISLCASFRINPLPYLVAEILASNAGSVMTITGNPQNMLIGMSSGISYTGFLLFLMPVALLSLLLVVGVIRWVYRSEFSRSEELKVFDNEYRYEMRSMRLSVPVFVFVIAMFFSGRFFGISIPVIALLGASMIMILGKVKPSEIIKEVDWVLLLFFASLFIVIRGVEKAGLMEGLLNSAPLSADARGVAIVHGISLIASQVVSNVPFTVAMLPLMKAANSGMLWISLASASTLAGNATIIGAMANLIVIESATRHNIRIAFVEFLKTGLITTLLSFVISFGTIMAWHWLGLTA